MVRAQKRLIDHLGIDRLFAVVGGSMGGMQVLAWAALYPDAVFAAVPIATAAYHSAQNIAFHEVGRQAIFADPDWLRRPLLGPGRDAGARPRGGAHDRAHHLPVAKPPLTRKFGRKLRDAQADSPRSATVSRWRATCNTRAASFVRRFDAQFLSHHHPRHGSIRPRGRSWRRRWPTPSPARNTRFLLVSLHLGLAVPDRDSRAIARALNHVAANVCFVEIASDKGHDAFLLDEPDFHRTLAGFLAGCAEHAGLTMNVPVDPVRYVAKNMRVDLALIAEHDRARARACWISAAPTAR